MTETASKVENGRVGIPHEYFLKMAKHDYNNWKEALPREFYQNSIDADATFIKVRFHEEDRSITVTDNGCGMTREIILHKLLVLGGTHKKAGAVGAFGKAKELLFFSWDKYLIQTSNLVVKGRGADFVVEEFENLVPFKGTICTIWVPETEDFDYMRRHFRWTAEKMQAPCRIFVDGHEIKTYVRKGRTVRTFPFGTLHQTKNRNNGYLTVRIGGIWMFERYIGDGYGELVLELSKTSLEALTSNRDGLKGEYTSRVDAVIKDLLVNKRSALRKKPADVIELIPGLGEVDVTPDDMADIEDAIKEHRRLKEAIETMLEDKGHGPMTGERTNALMDVAAEGGGVPDIQRMREALEFFGYKPDFVVRHDNKRPKWVKKFMKTRRARLLAKMWTECVRQVMIDNRMWNRFTAGFTFDDNVGAQYVRKGGKIYFLLNPTKDSVKVTNRWVLTQELKGKAIHEVAHLIEEHHDEDFVDAMATLRRGTYRHGYFTAWLKIPKIKA
jgi:hypothetical protein